MKFNRPFAHLFRTPGGYYIYDVNKNTIIRTQPDTWKIIRDKQEEDLDGFENSEIISKMLSNGFLSSNRVKEIIHPADSILMYYLNRKIKMITLQVTQQCNLRCKYCVYSGVYDNRVHSDKKMDFDMAKKCIDFYIEHSIDSETIIIGFYGGEPLIEFELIKKCILYVESISEGKDLVFTITTNGTLLNKEIIQFFEEHKVWLRISFDGPREIHDKSRKFAFNNCGTFDRVMENIEIIRSKFPQYYKSISFSMVLNQENDLSCITQFFTNYETVKGVRLFAAEIVGNYAKDKKSTSEDFNCKMGYEHFLALLSKISLFNEEYVSKVVENNFKNLGRIYKQLQPTEALPEKAHHGGPCIPGAQRLFVNADGDMFPCERVSEYSEIMKIGCIDTGFNIDKIRTLLNIGKINEDKCKNCWAFRFCTLCSISADVGGELSGDKKESRCESVRNKVEYDFKDICTLNENNFDFGINNWFVTA